MTTLDGRAIMWTNKVRYQGVHLVSLKALSCNFDLIIKSFYLAFRPNAIYGKVGRLASVDVVIELFKKCMFILLYCLDACPISPSQLRSLNHAVMLCGRKILSVNTSVIAAECLIMFGSATSMRVWPDVKTDLLRDSC